MVLQKLKNVNNWYELGVYSIQRYILLASTTSKFDVGVMQESEFYPYIYGEALHFNKKKLSDVCDQLYLIELTL